MHIESRLEVVREYGGADVEVFTPISGEVVDAGDDSTVVLDKGLDLMPSEEKEAINALWFAYLDATESKPFVAEVTP